MTRPQPTDKRREYMRQYMTVYKVVKINFKTTDPADMEIYEHLKNQPNKAAYIKALIQRDMK